MGKCIKNVPNHQPEMLFLVVNHPQKCDEIFHRHRLLGRRWPHCGNHRARQGCVHRLLILEPTLVMSHIAIEKYHMSCPWKMVKNDDFPMKNDDFPVRYVSHYQRVTPVRKIRNTQKIPSGKHQQKTDGNITMLSMGSFPLFRLGHGFKFAVSVI